MYMYIYMLDFLRNTPKSRSRTLEQTRLEQIEQIEKTRLASIRTANSTYENGISSLNRRKQSRLDTDDNLKKHKLSIKDKVVYNEEIDQKAIQDKNVYNKKIDQKAIQDKDVYNKEIDQKAEKDKDEYNEIDKVTIQNLIRRIEEYTQAELIDKQDILLTQTNSIQTANDHANNEKERVNSSTDLKINKKKYIKYKQKYLNLSNM